MFKKKSFIHFELMITHHQWICFHLLLKMATNIVINVISDYHHYNCLRDTKANNCQRQISNIVQHKVIFKCSI
ncbi:hypothetical protein C0J52_17607 [Blattella germanica]|nr:hypothetical protein C0J52_17607 [Blattella germanica]